MKKLTASSLIFFDFGFAFSSLTNFGFLGCFSALFFFWDSNKTPLPALAASDLPSLFFLVGAMPTIGEATSSLLANIAPGLMGPSAYKNKLLRINKPYWSQSVSSFHGQLSIILVESRIKSKQLSRNFKPQQVCKVKMVPQASPPAGVFHKQMWAKKCLSACNLKTERRKLWKDKGKQKSQDDREARLDKQRSRTNHLTPGQR